MPQFNFNFPFAQVLRQYPVIMDSAVVWYDDTTLTSSGGVVTGQANRGTGGSTYDLSTVVGSPVLTTVNGLAAAQFDGATTYMTPAVEITLTQPHTAFLVIKPDVLPGGTDHYPIDTHVDGNTSNRHYFQLLTSTDSYRIFGGSGMVTGAATLDTNTRLMIGGFSGASSTFEVPGILTKTAGDAGANTWDFGTFGARVDLGAGRYFNGKMPGFVLFNGLLSTVDYNSVKEYLQFYWGAA